MPELGTWIDKSIVVVCDRYTYKGTLAEVQRQFLVLLGVEKIFNHTDTEITDFTKDGETVFVNIDKIEGIHLSSDLSWAEKYRGSLNQSRVPYKSGSSRPPENYQA